MILSRIPTRLVLLSDVVGGQSATVFEMLVGDDLTAGQVGRPPSPGFPLLLPPISPNLAMPGNA